MLLTGGSNDDRIVSYPAESSTMKVSVGSSGSSSRSCSRSGGGDGGSGLDDKTDLARRGGSAGDDGVSFVGGVVLASSTDAVSKSNCKHKQQEAQLSQRDRAAACLNFGKI